MIVGVEIKNVIPKVIPEKGYYVRMNWMFGDADGFTTTQAGPFPKGREDLLVEFLNVLNDMQNLYAETGRGGGDDYESVYNYDKYFDYENYHNDDLSDEEKENQRIRDYAGAEMVYEPDGYGDVASFESFEVFYCDGVTIDEYEVEIKSR